MGKLISAPRQRQTGPHLGVASRSCSCPHRWATARSRPGTNTSGPDDPEGHPPCSPYTRVPPVGAMGSVSIGHPFHFATRCVLVGSSANRTDGYPGATHARASVCNWADGSKRVRLLHPSRGVHSFSCRSRVLVRVSPWSARDAGARLFLSTNPLLRTDSYGPQEHPQ
jgi:hypothetical protein